MYREFLIKEPDELGDQAQIALVRSQGVLGVAIIDRALEIMDNAVGCQQEGLSLQRCNKSRLLRITVRDLLFALKSCW